MKTTITHAEEMQLLGLLTLARKHYAIIRQCDDEMTKLVEDEDDFGTLLSDAIYDERDELDTVLKNMKIEVKG